MNLGCWNVQGLGIKEAEVFTEINKYNINSAVLSETNKKAIQNK